MSINIRYELDKEKTTSLTADADADAGKCCVSEYPSACRQ